MEGPEHREARDCLNTTLLNKMNVQPLAETHLIEPDGGLKHDAVALDP